MDLGKEKGSPLLGYEMKDWVSQDLGLPRGSVVKNKSANAGEVRDVGSIWGWEDLLEEGMATCSSILV